MWGSEKKEEKKEEKEKKKSEWSFIKDKSSYILLKKNDNDEETKFNAPEPELISEDKGL